MGNWFLCACRKMTCHRISTCRTFHFTNKKYNKVALNKVSVTETLCNFVPTWLFTHRKLPTDHLHFHNYPNKPSHRSSVAFQQHGDIRITFRASLYTTRPRTRSTLVWRLENGGHHVCTNNSGERKGLQKFHLLDRSKTLLQSVSTITFETRMLWKKFPSLTCFSFAGHKCHPTPE